MADKIAGFKPTSKETSKFKREVRRKLRKYEGLHQQYLGRQSIENDLKEACCAKKTPQNVVLIAFALAKIESPKAPLTWTRALSAPERFGFVLWKLRPDADNDQNPLQWALESGAKDVVKFIVAWYILCGMNDEKKCFDLDQKRSIATWLQLVGDCDLFGGNEAPRDSVNAYHFVRNRYTLESLASWLIEPFIAGHPALQQFIAKILERGQLEIQPKDKVVTSICDEEDFSLLEFGELEDEGWEMLSVAASVTSL
mmetsp:Transcript_22439/g.48854  ORF Transcript_22439/g.48854 Transcript_22439/m.48854 type:complete len:255 (-) Transcript_22439:1354-2118(-)|eukprot:CAMPEP_0168809236 /NCGR_PEP_ID=MMETSP0726-20121227/2983_1 /TAXON_ID=265536 /ORGANISM="Amphiprora sp., Strain CCMP467" /LENGTH=254 /DNA_ID=CAMNT_0008861217 /DNA_START=56 /DNA_END=820 /DNA_ORIENTATION=-